ncbi:unnamed protein product [Thlaspi arvense]|uniref:DC1 domain-containing protein n=1 Tax=Thlaspi arvense TaxID=13288 RepID=A0AAU9RMD4_THLAR|nr:unnamed protein product [Thlaspi arvense]
MYRDGHGGNFDLICSSITAPFTHGSHPHPLFYLKLARYGDLKKCQGCGRNAQGAALGCIKCDFYLDFRCATLPTKVGLPRYDDHPLTLCYDEEASGKYWRDICETETNPETWYYTCCDCGVTLHVLCVLGDIRYAKYGGKFDDQVELLPNDTSSRPFCSNCHRRCPGNFILNESEDDQLFCSLYCFAQTIDTEYYWSELRCPPWALKPNTF